MYKLIDFLVEKMQFQMVCKQLSLQPTTMNDILRYDPRKIFFDNCKNQAEPVLDLLNKISDKSIVLEEYTLGEGQCSGFMKACELEDELVSKVYLDNCGLKPTALTLFLKGLLF